MRVDALLLKSKLNFSFRKMKEKWNGTCYVCRSMYGTPGQAGDRRTQTRGGAHTLATVMALGGGGVEWNVSSRPCVYIWFSANLWSCTLNKLKEGKRLCLLLAVQVS